MTAIDMGELRQQYERYDTCTEGHRVGYLGCKLADQVPALCDALDAERARTRVLREALRDAMRFSGPAPSGAYASWLTALAATGDDGGGA
jgi:hypothetical protein